MKNTRWLLIIVFILFSSFVFSQNNDGGNKNIEFYDIDCVDDLSFGQSGSVDNFEGKSFGLNVHWSTGYQLQMASMSGARWIRTGVSWADVEPEFFDPPRYNWEMADKIVADARALDLNMLWGFGNTPPWASSNGQRSGVPKDKIAQERWRAFVRETAQRYKDDVHYFDVWNEPNLDHFWMGSVEEWVSIILIPAWEEIKAVNPDNKVVGPSLALLGKSARIKVDKFFSRLGKLGASRYIDIIGQHAYEDKPEEILRQFEKGDYDCVWIFCFKQRDSLYKIYRHAGFGNHQIWLTEFGWRTDKVGEKRQANRLVDTVKRVWRRPRFMPPIIYELQDDPRFTPKWGILRSDSTPKESFNSLFKLSSNDGVTSLDESSDYNEYGLVFYEEEETLSYIYLDEE